VSVLIAATWSERKGPRLWDFSMSSPLSTSYASITHNLGLWYMFTQSLRRNSVFSSSPWGPGLLDAAVELCGVHQQHQPVGRRPQVVRYLGEHLDGAVEV